MFPFLFKEFLPCIMIQKTQPDNPQLFFQNPWDRWTSYLQMCDYSKIFIISDSNTKQHCVPYFYQKTGLSDCPQYSIQAGESSKNLSTCEHIWEFCLNNQIDRNSLIIALGGGVVCDITGFCASSLLRGIDFIYIPTSLMAMSDAAHGGKNGINFKGFKNQIGLFNAPKAVLIDTTFLETLPDRHLKNGYVEMIKHAFIDNPPYWEELCDYNWPLDTETLKSYLKKSIRTKMDIVDLDFHEKGPRKMLNFGHTYGHAIESMALADGTDILHGEAIALGMLYEAWLSDQLFNWKSHWLAKFTALLKPFLPTFTVPLDRVDDLIYWMNGDKKKSNHKIGFSLLEVPGKGRVDIEVKPELIIKSLEYYNII